MVEDFLAPLYTAAFCGADLEAVHSKLLEGKLHTANVLMEDSRPDLMEACRLFLEWDQAKGQRLYQGLLAFSQSLHDGTALADLVGEEILPAFYDCMALWGHIREEAGGYMLESSRSGFLTLYSLESKAYIHSRINPLAQARRWAESLYSPSQESYALLGGGLGYLAYALYEMSDGAAKLQVFYRDGQLAKFALGYGVLGYIPEEQLEIVVSEDVEDFLRAALRKGVDSYIYPPSIGEWPPKEAALLDGLSVETETVRLLKPSVERNVFWNSQSGLPLFGEMDWSVWPKTYLVAAGGPGLDGQMDWIRQYRQELAIVAVGTVWRKMMKEGIRPDVVAVLDPHRRVLAQMEGLEGEDVPLLIGMQAHFGFARLYQGPKFLCVSAVDVGTPGWNLDLGKEQLWNRGSTVSCMAIEAALRMGAERIYLAGLDLAFPGGRTHAAGTLDYAAVGQKSGFWGESVTGEMVETDGLFLEYKQEIEALLEREAQGVEVINLSREGLRIQGTRGLEEL